MLEVVDIKDYIYIYRFQVFPSSYFPWGPTRTCWACTSSQAVIGTERVYLIPKVSLLNFWPQPQADKAVAFSCFFLMGLLILLTEPSTPNGLSLWPLSGWFPWVAPPCRTTVVWGWGSQQPQPRMLQTPIVLTPISAASYEQMFLGLFAFIRSQGIDMAGILFSSCVWVLKDDTDMSPKVQVWAPLPYSGWSI